MNLRDLQQHQPWGTKVREQYKSEVQSDERQIAHAITHAVKAAGRLTELVEASEHADGLPVNARDAQKYVADLVVIALRLAKLLNIDLDRAVITRIKEKNHDWIPPAGTP